MTVLKQHINLDPPTEFGRVLGRDHRLVKFEESRALALECSDFASPFEFPLQNRDLKAQKP